MSRARKGFALYSFTFAVVNWLDATVCLATLGQYAPGWPFQFAAWYALRDIAKRKRT